MKNRITRVSIVLGALTMLFFNASSWSQNKLSDPYEIFNKYFEAIGGLEKEKAETTKYIEAEISAFGLQGTLETWSKSPILGRQSIDLKVFKQISGDNGESSWVADANGKVQINKDEDFLKRREIRKLTAEYDYLSRNSSTFKLTLEGNEKVGDADCYVVKTANNINSDYTLTYFNIAGFLIEKEISHTPNSESHTLYTDYRPVNGILRSFHQEITELPEKNNTSLRITRYEPNIDIDPTLFEPPQQDARDYRFTDGNSAENVPFEYIMEHLFIPVNVGGKERLWIFDTGAGVSVIDSAFAVSLGLKLEGNIVGQGSGGTKSFSFVKMPPFSVKGIQFDEQTVATLDFQKMLSMTGWEATGILGYDFISRFVIKVDYANRTMSFYDPKSFVYRGDGKILETALKNRHLIVPVTIDGKYEGKWDLDLGAGGCDFTYPYAEKNDFLKRKGVDNVSFGAADPVYGRTVQFDSFELAGYRIEKPLISMPRKSLVGAFGDAELAGNIGNDILQHFVLYIDFGKQQLIIEKGKDFDRIFPRSKGGMQIMYNDKKQPEIIFVADDTPAFKAGFKKGDIITAVNDIGADNLNGLVAMRNLMQADAGTNYKLSILRDGQKKDIRLILAELY
jgi:hypothetical protein